MLRFIIMLVWLACTLVVIHGIGNGEVRCIDSERQALLDFKQGLVDLSNMLSSWSRNTQQDCCDWYGVTCHNQTGHVLILDLHNQALPRFDSGLSGEIGSSLLALPYLTQLNLQNNHFQNIPLFVGSLNNLTYLDLSMNAINGTFPYHLGNLSKLQYLDLSYNLDMEADNSKWLTQLSSLTTFYLSSVNFTKASDWLHSIKMHPSLSTLDLWDCQFPEMSHSSSLIVNPSNSLVVLNLYGNTFSSTSGDQYSWLTNLSTALIDLTIASDDDSLLKFPSFQNFCHLKRLDLFFSSISATLDDILQNLSCANMSLTELVLRENKIKGGIPDIIGEMKYLEYVDLSYNQLKGDIPTSVKNLCFLKELDLSYNQIEGGIATSFKNLCFLKELDLSYNLLSEPIDIILQSLMCSKNSIESLTLNGNRLKGSIDGISEFKSLESLSAANNDISGSFTQSIGKLPNLTHLYLSYNSHLNFDFNSTWVPSFMCASICLSSCSRLGPHFPNWIRTQKALYWLDISNCSISDGIPNWFWNLYSPILHLNLSNNYLSGQIPNHLLIPSTFLSQEWRSVDLSNNLFHGTIPQFLTYTTLLNLSKNKFSGSLSFLCNHTLNGELKWLDLSNNRLSGGLPDCWVQMQKLLILNLENNNLSGTLPFSLGSLIEIESLHLRNNNFRGKLPSSLKNCTNLILLDLGENKLTGELPPWIGEYLESLVVLRLRSNEFFGKIPLSICHLQHLQVLDLSFNKFSRIIPNCLNNLTAMTGTWTGGFNNSNASINSIIAGITSDNPWFSESTLIFWKGIEQEYGRTLGLLRIIDLSSNNLVGDIPDETTSLKGLRSLNLSRNELNGTIPMGIGKLMELEVLDLSHNHLSGELPSSMADLSFLAQLDLSSNKLMGRIPKSTQLQSFPSSAYMDNPGLCGLPLPNKCIDDEPWTVPSPTGSITSRDNPDEMFDRSSVYEGMGVGFFVGFWGTCGPLVISRRWRHTYFGFLSNTMNWLHVRIALQLGRWRFNKLRAFG